MSNTILAHKELENKKERKSFHILERTRKILKDMLKKKWKNNESEWTNGNIVEFVDTKMTNEKYQQELKDQQENSKEDLEVISDEYIIQEVNRTLKEIESLITKEDSLNNKVAFKIWKKTSYFKDHIKTLTKKKKESEYNDLKDAIFKFYENTYINRKGTLETDTIKINQNFSIPEDDFKILPWKKIIYTTKWTWESYEAKVNETRYEPDTKQYVVQMDITDSKKKWAKKLATYFKNTNDICKEANEHIKIILDVNNNRSKDINREEIKEWFLEWINNVRRVVDRKKIIKLTPIVSEKKDEDQKKVSWIN